MPVYSSPVQDKLAEAWDAVEDDPRVAKMSQDHTADETVDAIQNNAQQVTGKVVAVLAFKTVNTLEQKRRDNDKKVISLHIGMRDMMGSSFLLNDMEDDKLIAPDGTNIEDRLKSLVERTADNIKACWNVCDAFMKKRLLAKVLFEQLVNPEQKQLSDLVKAKGGIKALRNDGKTLLDLEKTATLRGIARVRLNQAGDADLEADSLRKDVLEESDAAAEKNWVVFSRKLEAQENQIIDELTLVVQRESDRVGVVQELKDKAHERIRDRYTVCVDL
ncbi:hypothetical protein F5888DRAFT_1633046 [Russula emetica]|nr:hypothetical protein F5888DRAFT_1633046 [Russula emetica]